MNYHLKVYGCQYNEWDAARINFMLQKIGLNETDSKDADLIFIIACAVRQTAVDRILGQLKNLPNKTIIITGCILSQDKIKFEKRNAHLWDNKKPDDLIEIFKKAGLAVKLDASEIQRFLKFGNTQSAYLPIMSGCNNFCSYCAVPYTKGREVSRPVEEIVKDFQILIEKESKEIMLLGQNVNSYQHDFSKLLKTLNHLPGDFQITFTSNHPKDMSDELIDTIASCQKVKKLIHLPLQSGSDKILKAMNRPYTRDQYIKLVEKIKAKIYEVKITTDVIVGFPGEEEEDFQNTVEVFKKVKYFAAYINKYSPRSGTAAYKLGDPIDWKEKERRWHILNDIAYHKKNL